MLELEYTKGDWDWLYEADVLLPGASYSKAAILNVGQHNFVVARVAAFTYLPFQGKTEISSKLQYIVNSEDCRHSLPQRKRVCVGIRSHGGSVQAGRALGLRR